MEGRLHFKFSKHLAWVRSDQWLLRYSTFCPVNLSLVGCKTHRHTHTIVNAGVPLANLSRFDGISSWARLTD